ncbi:SusC/RagA family TonB-linked outer membrane protein [Pedobacter sp. MC2016-24]|uniref:SusC/RagA family TonB-linked outer membrane protein n=1 Tax=Pedobacter sp. MC2016-24 TaxID=2780090 RepID=UPI00188206F5|nr:SusC/RagA family TonB-linked outer membrane protein [Pedobacter sp. MC2016-24]MBE9600497.1 SusC/RagA family TonB-linked outer membrane protein [Pedobacter sp. MC2016-24]
MKRKLLMLFLSTFLLVAHAMAQQITVTGKVTSADDRLGVPGASVKIKGAASATQTNVDGAYSIKASKGDVLVFSYIGFVSQEKTVADAAVLNVVLATDSKALSEVVVTALGIERNKRTLTYSVQTVKGDDLRNSNQSNLINALQGQVAGAQISSSGGSPGLPSEIILRGSTTLSGDNQPLMIVDGIRVNNNSANGTVNRLADFNPEDIENVSILKGAAAAALYGIDAASGAIIITTKQGKAGTLQVSGSYKSFLETMGRTPRQQGIYTVGTGGVYDASSASSWGRKFRYDEKIYNNIDRFFETAITHDVNVNVNGGSEKLNYYVSGGYRNGGSMVPNTNQEKINLLMKGTAKLSSKIELTTSANYIKNNIQEGLGGASEGGWINSILRYPRMNDILEYQKPNGEPLYSYVEAGKEREARISPMWGVMRNPRNNDVERFLVNNNLVYKANDWITLNYRLGQDYTNSKYRIVTTPGTPGSNFGGSVTENNGVTKFVTSNFTSTFDKKFLEDFRATLIAGFSSEYYDNKSLSYTADNFLVGDIFSPNVVNKENLALTESWLRRQRYAVFGDLKLEYKNLVAIGITGRNDWTSTLPSNARTFYSPSYSASFSFSELFENKDSWFGKLRGSYARVGKDAPIYRTNTNLVSSLTVGGGFVTSATGGNPNLGPETTEEFEMGTELSFFKRRLNFDIAYYQRKSLNMIMTPRVPLPSGYVIMTFNAGSLRNRGVEFSVTGTPVKTDDFTWTSTLNAWKNTSKMLQFAGDIVTFKYTNAQLNAGVAATSLNEPVLGIVGSDYKRNEDGYIVVDKNGYPVLDNNNKERYIGNREPEFNIGFINNFKYKQFNLSFLWDFRIGGDILNASRQGMMANGIAYDIGQWRDKEFVFNGVVQQDDGTYIKNNKKVVLDYSYFANNYYSVGTNFVEKVNWARVRYITLGYQLPKTIASKLGFKNLGLELAAQNPFVITNYSGGDPEVNSAGPNAGGSGASTMGVDNGAIPLPRSFSLGINVTL